MLTAHLLERESFAREMYRMAVRHMRASRSSRMFWYFAERAYGWRRLFLSTVAQLAAQGGAA